MQIDNKNQRVAADMERVFRPIADRRTAADSTADRTDRSGHATSLRWLTIAIVAAAMITAVLLAGYWWGAVPPTSIASTPPSRNEPSPVGQTPVAVAAAIAPAAPIGNIEREPRSLPRAVAPTSILPLSSVPNEARQLKQLRKAAPLPPPEVAHDDGRDGIIECRPGSLADRCIYQDVLNADARLDRAYERASRAGVSPDRLAAINERWTRARDDENPDRMIRRYEVLIEMLDAERREITR